MSLSKRVLLYITLHRAALPIDGLNYCNCRPTLHTYAHRAALAINYCNYQPNLNTYIAPIQICYSKLDSSQLLQDETATDVVLYIAK